MEELLRRHAGEFDEAYHLIDTVDLIKNGITYRIEIHQKMAIGYRKQFVARYFKKTKARKDEGIARATGTHDGETTSSSESTLIWVALQGVDAVADTPRDTLNQALIWLGIYTKQK